MNTMNRSRRDPKRLMLCVAHSFVDEVSVSMGSGDSGGNSGDSGGDSIGDSGGDSIGDSGGDSDGDSSGDSIGDSSTAVS